MLDLEFLGIGSAFCPRLGNTSAIFWKGDSLYLLDCGSTVFSALDRCGALPRADRITALITHTHADHTGSLGTLISYCKHVHPVPVTIVHPEQEIGRLLRLNGITPEQYRLRTADQFEDESITVRFFPVPHTKSLNAWGILISDREETVYYSGDAGDIPGVVWSAFTDGKIDRVYQDVSLTGIRGGSHGEYAWFARHCPEAFRSRFYPIHLDEACLARSIEDGFAQAMQAKQLHTAAVSQ